MRRVSGQGIPGGHPLPLINLPSVIRRFRRLASRISLLFSGVLYYNITSIYRFLVINLTIMYYGIYRL